ncbi:MAG TPA: fumarylacetoacetate hydrolase family protein [Phototrophicaceae bacterium]|nr:fumarylacetoacetate hydrolase family protein [Phototrophicaceae bacterium]
MKLATYIYDNHPLVGQVIENHVHTTAWSDPMTHLIRRGITPSRLTNNYPLDKVQLQAPLRPPKIVAIGRNYADHAAETGSAVPTAPLIFAKFPTSVIGNGEAITWDATITQQVDWEGELAVVIGKRARNVTEDEALNHVYGYTIANDVTARDLQVRIDTQWTRGKSLDTFCPLGPWLVTRDEIPDPHNLTIKTTVNGELMQDGNTRDLIFKIPTLIAYCSRMFTLEPGDLLLTGTPPGVGEGRQPPVYLKDGDVVSITIDGIGELTNPCRVLSA